MRRVFIRLVAGFVCGGVLLQTAGCTDLAIAVTTISSALTAGGVLYLVRRVVD
ncbi:MAG: hypothetical protein U1D55_09555 [Phycisphaerae bacterium]